MGKREKSSNSPDFNCLLFLLVKSTALRIEVSTCTILLLPLFYLLPQALSLSLLFFGWIADGSPHLHHHNHHFSFSQFLLLFPSLQNVYLISDYLAPLTFSFLPSFSIPSSLFRCTLNLFPTCCSFTKRAI